MADETLRVVIADDHPTFREGLVAVLSTAPDLEVVAQAGTGQEAVAAVSQVRPDVVVMEIAMPGLDGLEATRRIVAEHPRTGVVVLTMFDEDENVFRAMRSGARGYLLKGADRSTILEAVRATGRGNAFFGPAVAQRLMGYFSAQRTGAQPFGNLTAREHEVLDLLARGFSNAQIAQRIDVSAKTVRNHVSNIFAKLQVVDRGTAIARARQAGLGRDQAGS